MKNVIISLILFLAVMGFMLFANSKLIQLCNDISTESSQIEELLNAKKWDESYAASVKLLNKLEEDGTVSSVYINHTEVDALIDNTVKLTVLVKCKDESESLSTLHVIKYNAERIKELQYPSLKNIF
ncbi:DUF4363 family protein [Clostridium sardiniense]|uniref:DUF4363 family protein n=1 Tax=Clostridium sardiniense TaxID=29369 RepID=A0ABS7L0V3_CLOSR|nr:DUF4363 family protein [Clostridium sardiniense]MBY0756699.1 DUF4363 family protein [Clostridium sardiniense]MDQ0458552.1 hypothetical protein [Clostridium sardiniense]